MTNEEKRAVARAVAKQRTNGIQERRHIYIEVLSELDLKTNCCEENICGHPQSRETDTRLFR